MTPVKQRALVSVLIGLGIIFIGIFGLRTVNAFREFRSHRPPPPFKNEQPETDVELIRDWMTIPFIAHMYHVHPPVIFEALNIPIHNNEEKSLKQLNDEYYPDVDGFVEAKVKEVVLQNLPPAIPTVPVTPTLASVPTP